MYKLYHSELHTSPTKQRIHLHVVQQILIHSTIFLPVNYWKSLICEYNMGWLDDLIISFVTNVLNYPLEYDLATKGLSDNVPSLVFFHAQDNVKRINPCISRNESQYLRNDITEQEKDTDDIKKEPSYAPCCCSHLQQ